MFSGGRERVHWEQMGYISHLQQSRACLNDFILYRNIQFLKMLL